MFPSLFFCFLTEIWIKSISKGTQFIHAPYKTRRKKWQSDLSHLVEKQREDNSTDCSVLGEGCKGKNNILN